MLSQISARLGDRVWMAVMGGGVEYRMLNPTLIPYYVKRLLCRGPRRDLGGEVLEVASRAKRGMLAYIIDYNVDPGMLKEALRRARSRGLRILLVIIYEAAEVNPPGPGFARIGYAGGAVMGGIEAVYKSIRRHVLSIDAIARSYGRLVRLESSMVEDSVWRIVNAYLRSRSMG